MLITNRLRMDGRVRRLQRLNQLLDVHRLGEEQIPEEDGQTDRRAQCGNTDSDSEESARRRVGSRSVSQPLYARPAARSAHRLAVRFVSSHSRVHALPLELLRDVCRLRDDEWP